jgi:hypothetical protein
MIESFVGAIAVMLVVLICALLLAYIIMWMEKKHK